MNRSGLETTEVLKVVKIFAVPEAEGDRRGCQNGAQTVCMTSSAYAASRTP